MSSERLRIAVAMNGGVSLSVWMGGVSNELAALIQGRGAYADLTDMVQSIPQIDVIAGTSAGGLNGAMLALALVHGSDLSSLRRLWIETGSLDNLFRDPLADANPPSLLDGDSFFLRELRMGLRKLASGPLMSASDVPMDLTLTATELRGRARRLADDFGTVISETHHGVRFRFRRGPDLSTDAFADPLIVEKLALAGRSSASFPGAFEPSWIPVGEQDTTDSNRPLMDSAFEEFGSSWRMDRSGFVVDGGVLDNKPVEAALQGIKDQRSGSAGRRALLYVVPDPEAVAVVSEVDDSSRPQFPTLASVVWSSLVAIPRYESVLSELRNAREENRRSEEALNARLTLGELSVESLRRLAMELFPLYRASRIDRSVRYVVGEMSDGMADESGTGLPYFGRREELQLSLSTAELPWIPKVAPGQDWEPRSTTWDWGSRPLVEALSLCELVLSQFPWTPDSVGKSLNEVSSWVRSSRRLASDDQSNWRGYGRRIARGDYDQVSWLEEILGDYASGLVRVEVDGEPLDVPLKQAQEILLFELARLLSELVPAIRASDEERLSPLQLSVKRLLQILAPEESPAEEVVRRLVQYHVVLAALGRGAENPFDVVELMQVSGTTPSPFDFQTQVSARDKLTGVQMGHFGAFYKSSWRAGDWMTGRLDGSYRLIQLVVTPRSLRRVFASSAEATERIRALSRADPGDILASSWEVASADIENELAFLDDPAISEPDGIPQTIASIARSFQVDIAREEIPILVRAIDRDSVEGGLPKRSKGRQLSDAYRDSPNRASKEDTSPLDAADALRLLPDCNIGSELIADDIGTDRFAGTIATALAVGSAAARSKGSGIPWIRGLLTTARAPILLLYLLVRSSQSRRKLGAILTAVAVTFGLTILTVGLVADDLGVLVPFGWATLAAGIAALLLRRPGGLAILLTAVFLVGLAINAFFQPSLLPFLVGFAVLLVLGGLSWPPSAWTSYLTRGRRISLSDDLVARLEVAMEQYLGDLSDSAAEDEIRSAASAVKRTRRKLRFPG